MKAFLLGLLLAIGFNAQSKEVAGCTVEATFSPGGGALSAIAAELQGAKNVLIAGYSVTNPDFARAVLGAFKRGASVEGVFDAEKHDGGRASSSVYSVLIAAGIQVRLSSGYQAMHNKYLVIDGKTVITGSYNFSRAAENSNAENLVVIRNCPALAAQYTANFKSLR
jgi:phosphatidylserine/phosphatidylglycerophosphate/cardiolipin synthase-like enzyme